MTIPDNILRAHAKATEQLPELEKHAQAVREYVCNAVTADMTELEARCMARMLSTKYGRRLIQLLRNVNRPGLKPRRKKHWQRVLAKHRPPLPVHYLHLGVGVCNPNAIAKVRIYD